MIHVDDIDQRSSQHIKLRDIFSFSYPFARIFSNLSSPTANKQELKLYHTSTYQQVIRFFVYGTTIYYLSILKAVVIIDILSGHQYILSRHEILASRISLLEMVRRYNKFQDLP